MNANEGVWLSINDYSRYKGVSNSTIRRHIKNNILKYKEENGKYFIYVPSTDKLRLREGEELIRMKLELEFLKSRVCLLSEENSELKMLVQIYETRAPEILPEQSTKIDLPPEFSAI
jgi:hypothetical protein